MGRGTLYNLIARVAFIVSGYALQFSMAHWLPSPVDFGRFSVISNLTTLARMVFSVAIPQTLSKFVAADATNAVGTYRRGLVLQLAAAALMWLLLVLIAPTLAHLLGDDQLRSLLLLVSPLIMFLAFYQVNLGYVAGRLWFGWQALFTAAYSVSRCALPVAFVLGGFGINGALVGLVLSSAGSAALSWLAAPRGKQPSPVTARQFLSFSWPLAVFSFGVNALMNLDLLLLKRYFPESESVGFYSAAVNLGRTPYLVFQAFSATALPALSRFHASGDTEKVRSELARQVRHLLLLALPCSGLLAASGAELLQLVYGKAYAAASGPLALLSLSACALSLLVVLASALTACSKPRTSMLPALVCLPAQVLLGPLLIPEGGMFGTAVSNMLATLLGLSVALILTWRAVGAVIEARILLSASLSTLLATLAVLGLPVVTGVWILPKIGLGFVVYGIALLLTRGITLGELARLGRRVLKPNAASPESTP